jgi:hypothetical protein
MGAEKQSYTDMSFQGEIALFCFVFPANTQEWARNSVKRSLLLKEAVVTQILLGFYPGTE